MAEATTEPKRKDSLQPRYSLAANSEEMSAVRRQTISIMRPTASLLNVPASYQPDSSANSHNTIMEPWPIFHCQQSFEDLTPRYFYQMMASQIDKESHAFVLSRQSASASHSYYYIGCDADTMNYFIAIGSQEKPWSRVNLDSKDVGQWLDYLNHPRKSSLAKLVTGEDEGTKKLLLDSACALPAPFLVPKFSGHEWLYCRVAPTRLMRQDAVVARMNSSTPGDMYRAETIDSSTNITNVGHIVHTMLIHYACILSAHEADPMIIAPIKLQGISGHGFKFDNKLSILWPSIETKAIPGVSQTLAQLLATIQPERNELLLEVVHQVVNALSAVRSVKISLGNLKPKHIFISKNPEDGAIAVRLWRPFYQEGKNRIPGSYHHKVTPYGKVYRPQHYSDKSSTSLSIWEAPPETGTEYLNMVTDKTDVWHFGVLLVKMFATKMARYSIAMPPNKTNHGINPDEWWKLELENDSEGISQGNIKTLVKRCLSEYDERPANIDVILRDALSLTVEDVANASCRR